MIISIPGIVSQSKGIRTLNDYSWSEISAISKSGEASNYWSVGEMKQFSLIGKTFNAVIIGFDHDTPTDTNAYGRNRAGITFNQYEVDNGFKAAMNSNGSADGGWKNCDMRNTTLPDIYQQLDPSLQEVIVSVNKISDTGKGYSSELVTTSDTLFLLSMEEVYATPDWITPGAGTLYEYYQNQDNLKKPRHESSGSYSYWWCRDSVNFSFSCFISIADNGSYNTYYSAENNCNISFAFCV